MRKSILRHTAAGTAVAAVAVGLIAIAGPADAATPTSTVGESSVQGTPTALKAGAPSGDYLWHDSRGYHLRVTHPGKSREVFTGVISSDTPMTDKPVALEKGDVVKLSNDRKTLTFSFVDYGRIDGVDFRTDSRTSLTVSRLHVGDRDLPTADVYLGAGGQHPSAIPFRIAAES